MRKLIAAFKISLDGKIEGSDGYADWVDAWSEDFEITPHIDACLLGGAMYPRYEEYWTAVQSHQPGTPLPTTGKLPSSAEFEWGRIAASLPHYVLSRTLKEVKWHNSHLVRTIDEIAALKAQARKSIYIVGGSQITSSLIEAGLVDEIRLIVYPLIAGAGKPLFNSAYTRQRLVLRKSDQLPDGRMTLVYSVPAN